MSQLKREWRYFGFVFLALATSFLLGGTAYAAGSAGSSQARVEFGLGTHSGYRLEFIGDGRKGTLFVHRLADQAVYQTETARTLPDGMRARFGRYGRVAVRFVPSGKVRREEPPRRCKGEPRERRFGKFVGTIRFRGEKDYVKVRTREARGVVEVSSKWRCKYRRSHGSHQVHESEDLNSVLLLASAKQNGSSFVALDFRVPGQKNMPLYTASVAKKTGRLLVFHTTSVWGGARAFSFDDGLTTATVEPGAPFHGTATFQRNADGSTSWTGTLHVFMPGVGDLRLVGPGFEAELEHPRVTNGQGIAIFNVGAGR